MIDAPAATPALPVAGETVVTVNNRLARALAAAHASAMLESGARGWEAPRVLPFEAFVAAEWNAAREVRLPPPPRLLGAAQVRALWQDCLQAPGVAELLSPAAAAAAAAAARELLLRHRAELGAAECRGHPDAHAFLAWHARFRERLREGAWIDLPGATSALAEAVRAGHARVPARLRLVGFDGLTPQQTHLVDALREAGAAVCVERPPPPAPAARRTVLPAPEDELEAAARWARALLDAGQAGPVGIVVPDLERRLESVQAVLEDLLHPAPGVAPLPAPGARAFEVSLGQSLSRLPVVADALAALETALGSPGAEAAGRCLLSPLLAGAREERGARLALEARLRDEGVRSIRSRHLARLAARAGCPVFARALQRAAGVAPAQRARQRLELHAAAFADILERLGWPRGRALDSAEHQAVEALRTQLAALGGAGAVRGPCGAPAALSLLAGMLHETPFQPQGWSAPVQVLGVLEAAGMSFRALWITGLHDGAWPPPEAPSPLLPMALQRRHDMPGAAPERSLARARRLTVRLLGAAPAPVVSHAAADGEEALRVSPLVEHLEPVSPAELPRAGQPLPDAALAGEAPVAEQLADWRARPVGHNWRARGGSRVLTDQAACPFRAFARHRLGAEGVARAPAPLDARSRGVLAHRLMQALFQQLPDRDAIVALDAAGRQARAEQAAAEAVRAVLRRHPGMVAERLAGAERRRLAELATRWLALEAARAPFAVEALEQRRSVRLGGLALDIQLDRVDRVGGRRLLMDYKTGRTARAAWFGERPDEPQLPLYALALDADGGAAAPVAAVCFARLRRGEEGFDGVAEEPAWAPGLAPLGRGSGGQKEFPDMAALKAHWAEVLSGLAQAFAAGDAAVDPKRGACDACDLQPLCRVGEVRAVASQEDL